MEIISPILIVGNQYLSRNNISSLKSKYGEFYCFVQMSASKNSLEEIDSAAGVMDFLDQPKVILIEDLPNQKAVREFILDLASQTNDRVKFIVWDSTNAIKFDPKTKQANKTWSEFIAKFERIPNAKIINNGADFTEKDDNDCMSFVKNCFAKNKKNIKNEAVALLISIVGRDRGLLLSEVEKLCAGCKEEVTLAIVAENAFPTSKEAILYKLGNALDEGYSKSISMMEQFLDAGINANVLAEIMAKKARWQLAAAHLYSKGMDWFDVDKCMVNMGKFPSCVWQSNMGYDQKQKASSDIETFEGFNKYITRDLGLPDYYFSPGKKKVKAKEEDIEEKEGEEKEGEKKAKKVVSVPLGKKEILPMPFMATQITSALHKNFVLPNGGKMSLEIIKEKLLNHALNVYLGVVEKLKDIRYGDSPEQALYDMVRILTDRNLEN